MRYWESDRAHSVDRTPGAFRDFRPRTRPASSSSVVTGGGSVGPFLRRVYRHQVALSGPLQRLVMFLLLAGVIYAFVLGDGGAIRILMLRHDRASLDKRIGELQHSAALLETEIARLESDSFYIEKTGRERYGYIKPGDKVYKIVAPVESSR